VTSTTLYTGTSGGVFASPDGAGSWSAASIGLPPGTDVRGLAIDPMTPATLYAGTNGGVFKSTNGGANWAAINAGLASVFTDQADS